MNPEKFAVPFIVGTLFLFGIVAIRFTYWIVGLSKIDKLRILKSLPTRTTWTSVKESFREGLIHRKIYKQNPVLGYMHMSLAFGWFLLIIVGHIEVATYKKSLYFPFYKSIFFRYYTDANTKFPFSEGFSFLMDFLLLVVLSGVALAYFKRIYKRAFGMKKTTRLQWRDYIALTSLWFIFPLRLLAESITAGIKHNGGFMTQPLGNYLASVLPLHMLMTPVWYAYSFSLGIFFFALPASRYMHIPTEILYIFLKNAGIKLKKFENTYARVQTFSCSRCGICLDSCQMNQAGIKHTQSVYVLKNIRNRTLTDNTLFNCLLCGRCEQVCPVDIDLNDLRIVKRIEKTQQYNSTYDFLKDEESIHSKVIYFAGCMSHLTPAIIKSMKTIFEEAGVDYWFMDEKKAPCCGRPLMQAGQRDAAMKLIEMNQKQILASGAKTLVVSCPICFKVFNEDYQLPNVKVVHHSDFIFDLIRAKKLQLKRTQAQLIYHDPCELGRGSGLYETPRELIRRTGTLIPIKNEKEKALCCGGSLSNIKITASQREVIRNAALNEYKSYHPDALVTACPLCKKTFAMANTLPVIDIAEVIAGSLVLSKPQMQGKKQMELV